MRIVAFRSGTVELERGIIPIRIEIGIIQGGTHVLLKERGSYSTTSGASMPAEEGRGRGGGES